MKNRILVLALALAALALSCSKSDTEPQASGDEPQASESVSYYAQDEEFITFCNQDILNLLARCAGGNEFKGGTSGSVFLSDEIKIGTCKFIYQSLDGQGNPVMLSGRLYYPCNESGTLRTPDHVALACHHTIATTMEAPSSGVTIEALPSLHGALVIAPDYIGHGITSDRIHPFCTYEASGRNCTDMLRCAFSYFKEKGIDCTDLPLYIEGYSQGGYVSLAVTKYIQCDLSNEFHITNTYCGSGPYSHEAIAEDWFSKGFCTYSVIPVFVIMGYKAAYPEIMTEDLSAYFSDAFNKSGLIDVILAKNTNQVLLANMIHKAVDPEYDDILGVGARFDRLFNPDAFTPGGKLYEQICKCAEKSSIDSGWSPETPVHFVHNANDMIVPFSAFLAAKEGLMNENTCFEELAYTLFNGHVANSLVFYTSVALGEYLKVYPGGETVTDNSSDYPGFLPQFPRLFGIFE